MSLDNLTVIGCSAFGRQAVWYMVPQLDLSSKAVLIVPHIENWMIYGGLLELGVPTKSITPVQGDVGGDVTFETGNVYVLGGEYRNLFMYGELSFAVDGTRIRVTDENKSNIDPVLHDLVDIYGAKTRAVILTGCGLDCVAGSQYVKQNGGKVFVQTDSPEGAQEFQPWRYISEMAMGTKEAVNVDYAGTLRELVDVLNKD